MPIGDEYKAIHEIIAKVRAARQTVLHAHEMPDDKRLPLADELLYVADGLERVTGKIVERSFRDGLTCGAYPVGMWMW